MHKDQPHASIASSRRPFFFDGEEDWEAFHSRAHHPQVEAQHSRKIGRMPGRKRRALPQCCLDLAHHIASATAAAAATTRMSAEALVLAAQIADQQAVVAAAQYQLMQQQGLRSRSTTGAAAPNTPPVGDPAPHEQPMTPRSLPMTPPLLSGSATQPTKAQHIPGRLRKSVARRCASSLVRGSHKSKPRPTVSREPREHPVAAPIPCEPHGSARDSIARPHAQSVQTKSLSPAVAKLSKSPSAAAQREQTKPRFVRPPTIRPRPPTVSATNGPIQFILKPKPPQPPVRNKFVKTAKQKQTDPPSTAASIQFPRKGPQPPKYPPPAASIPFWRLPIGINPWSHLSPPQSKCIADGAW